MKTNPNESAFAIPAFRDEKGEQQKDDILSHGKTDGLTKREYMATMILQGLMANPERYKYIADLMNTDKRNSVISQELATQKNVHKAVLIADALIAELNKGS